LLTQVLLGVAVPLPVVLPLQHLLQHLLPLPVVLLVVVLSVFPLVPAVFAASCATRSVPLVVSVLFLLSTQSATRKAVQATVLMVPFFD